MYSRDVLLIVHAQNVVLQINHAKYYVDPSLNNDTSVVISSVIFSYLHH